MKARIAAALVGLAVAGAQPALAQGLGHTFFMRGSIVSLEGSEVVICIGKADGAQVNQVLDVYRVRAAPGPQKGVPNFQRQLIGHVTIDNIFNDHFAHARVTQGSAARNDIVELRRTR